MRIKRLLPRYADRAHSRNCSRTTAIMVCIARRVEGADRCEPVGTGLRASGSDAAGTACGWATQRADGRRGERRGNVAVASAFHRPR